MAEDTEDSMAEGLGSPGGSEIELLPEVELEEPPPAGPSLAGTPGPGPPRGLDPHRVLPQGWRYVDTHEIGLIGSFWRVREPSAGFTRSVKALGYGEHSGTFIPAAEGRDALKPFVIPWQPRPLRTPGAFFLVSPRPPPVRAFKPEGEDALSALHGVAHSLMQFHKHGYSMNFLCPASIGIETSSRGPRAVFVDYGLSLRATTRDMRAGRVPSPAVTPENVAYWAPEVPRRLDLHKPASAFHPQADSYFLAVALLEILYGGFPWAVDGWDAALEGHEHLAEAVAELGLEQKRESLLQACVDRDPKKRLGVNSFVSMLQTPRRREVLWAKRRLEGTRFGAAYGGLRLSETTPGTDPSTILGELPSGPLDETMLDPMGLTGGASVGASKQEARKERRAQKAAAKQAARSEHAEADGEEASSVLKGAALGVAGVSLLLALGLAASWSGLVARSPVLAVQWGVPLRWPDLDAERERHESTRRALFGSKPRWKESALDVLAATEELVRQSDQVWASVVPEWRAATQKETLGEELLRFGDAAGALAQQLGSRTTARDAELLSRGRAHYDAVRGFNARLAARVAVSLLLGRKLDATARRPMWVPTRPGIRVDAATARDRAQARAALLAWAVRGEKAAGREVKNVRNGLQEAFRKDPDLIEALIEEGLVVARKGGSWQDRRSLQEAIERKFPPFELRHHDRARTDAAVKARLEHVSRWKDYVLGELKKTRGQ